jgi:hypothetical protein
MKRVDVLDRPLWFTSENQTISGVTRHPGLIRPLHDSPRRLRHPGASIVETFREASPNPRTLPPCFLAVPALLQPVEAMPQQIFYLLVTLCIVATLWSS